MVPKVRRAAKERRLRDWRRCRRARLRLRSLSVVNLLNGRGAYRAAGVLGVHPTTAWRVARRSRAPGEGGRLEGREDNGAAKLEERYLATL